MMSGELIRQKNADPIFETDFLDYALNHDFTDLHFKVDPKSGMRAIIAIHSTSLGPALGGCRFIEYPNTDSAIYDAMRLARGMSYKAASVNLPLGGGKAVIIRPKADFDRAAYFHAFGEFVETLNGRYITALDSGSLLTDMDIVHQHTPYVASLSQHNGDPSPSTALGVLRGIEATVAHKRQQETLDGIHVAIQGLGHVGMHLARLLHQRGAQLTVTDLNPANVEKAVKEFGAKSVRSADIHRVSCDVFSPCALGAVLHEQSIDELQTDMIAGAANNQLAHAYHGQILHDKGILFAVDYVINSGGLIFAASQYLFHDAQQVAEKIDGIKTAMLEIFERSAREDKPTNLIADQRAREKIQQSA
ncbi:MAG: amino acid dehydrogenase [Legionellaceae bacterium]|nr:amino acid dehydrogenase [Legionellaceae bacterium]